LVSGVGSKVVPVRLDDDLLKLVDELVRLGVYSSRGEALRGLIRIGARYVRQIKIVAKAVNKLFEMEKEEGIYLLDLKVLLGNCWLSGRGSRS